MKENVLAFISGSISGLLAGLGQQLFTTALLGFAGGLFGIAGKDVYNYFKKKIK
jgi:hypothetical protein